ncbi:RicAFT regulatory complex protein RicA family protein [Paenibacillus pinistramenti]|uniref:RicAFT regulatory complex protein RicA family protein n=1 Tax=Paenibacillus pinistramenti TaxID=1768003 RepID=UPI003B83288D
MPNSAPQRMFARNEILQKSKELAELIGESEEVRVFKQAEQQIENHERIQSLISQMKKKQKEIVAFESMRNQDMVTRIEKEIDELQAEIDAIPLVTEYQQSQADINYLLQFVVSAIQDTVSQKLNVESGTEAPPSRCD